MIPVNRNTERINIHIQEKQEQVKQEKPKKFEKDVIGNENRAPGHGDGAVGKENAGVAISVRSSSFRKRCCSSYFLRCTVPDSGCSIDKSY